MTRVLSGLMQVIVLALLLWQGLRLVVRPDPLDGLRQGDALFIAGRYHDARAIYDRVVAQSPQLARAYARQGMVAAVRGEREAASRALAFAIGQGLRGEEHDVARLYQGRVALQFGHPDEAEQFWHTISPRSSLLPIRKMLEAEQLLHAGAYASAQAAFRAVPPAALPAEWRALQRNRLAVLQVAHDPAGALALLQQAERTAPVSTLAPHTAALVAPLLPVGGPDTAALQSALQADSTQRAQLLGQVFLDGRLYALAAMQFAVAADKPNARVAAAYAAYARWLAGDRAAGRQQLQALIDAHPNEPRARALLALTYLADSEPQRAQAQLTAVRALAPRAPDTHLAWAQWYATTSDYIAAAAEYRRAADDAAPDQRGTYLLVQARFHVETDVQICEAGLPAAEEAALLLPRDGAAWTMLAAARLRCADPAGARAAAQRALTLDPASAEATYYLGRALALLGDRSGARAALISAADLAPDSPWRERAETQLGVLGL